MFDRSRTLATALALAFCTLPATTASAHGPNPAVLDGGARDADDTAWLVRLSRGLARETGDGTYEYLCPQRFHADQTVFMTPLDDERAIVLGLSDVYVVPRAGEPERVVELPFSVYTLRSLVTAPADGALALVGTGDGTALYAFEPEPRLVREDDASWRIAFSDGDRAWLARVEDGVLRWESVDGTASGSTTIPDETVGLGLAIRTLPDGWYPAVQVGEGALIGHVAPDESEGEVAESAWYGVLSPAFGGPAWHDGAPLWLDGDTLYVREAGALAEAGSTSFVELGGGRDEDAWGVSVRQLADLDDSASAGDVRFDLTDITAFPMPADEDELTQQQCYLDALDFAVDSGVPGPAPREGSGDTDGSGEAAAAGDASGSGGGCAAVGAANGARWLGPLGLLGLLGLLSARGRTRRESQQRSPRRRATSAS